MKQLLMPLLLITCITNCAQLDRQKMAEQAAKQEQFWAEHNEEMHKCNAAQEKGIYKTYFEKQKECTNPRTEAIYIKHKYPHMDVVRLMQAKLLDLAKQVDKGTINSDEAFEREREILGEGDNIANAREAIIQQRSAERKAAWGAALMGVSQGMQQGGFSPPVQQSFSRPQTTCTSRRMFDTVQTTCQ